MIPNREENLGRRIMYENTTGPIGDEFQYEELVMGIEEAFEIDLMECNWDENFTLGNLVSKVLESKKADRSGDGTY